MKEHLEDYLRCICHDRLYVLGVDSLERERLVERMIKGDVVGVIDCKNGKKLPLAFGPTYPVSRVLEYINLAW